MSQFQDPFMPYLVELNIGHSIVSRAVFTGMENAVRDMLAAMRGYPETPANP